MNTKTVHQSSYNGNMHSNMHKTSFHLEINTKNEILVELRRFIPIYRTLRIPFPHWIESQTNSVSGTSTFK